MSKALAAQRREWRTSVCANLDCGTTFASPITSQIYCSPNCRFRALHRYHAWRERRRAGKPPTPLERLLARVEETARA